MAPVTQQPAGKTSMSTDTTTQPTITNAEQQIHNHTCERRGGITGSILRLRGGGAGKDCLLGALGCFLCCECCEGCCECIADIICCPCEMIC